MQPEANTEAQPHLISQTLRPLLLLEWVIALLITGIAGYLFINGSFFGSYDAVHIDFSINWTASHALRDGDIPYGKTTLAALAASLNSPTDLVYGQLYTSYIQPPTSALHLLPLTVLDWREASRLYLVLNHLFLAAAIVISLVTLRPTLPLRWLIAGTALIVAFSSQLYMSFSLGQVDATIFLLLAIAFWAYTHDRHAITGSAIAVAVAIKLIPGVLLLYLLWRRELRPVLWAGSVGALMLLLSLAYVGLDTYQAFFQDTLPALARGSTQYSNISLGAVSARIHSPESFGGLPSIISLDEPPTGSAARLMSISLVLLTLGIAAAVLGRTSTTPRQRLAQPPVFEFFFVIAIALLISSVTWEFYTIWLTPVFLAAFLAPSRYLPGGIWRWLCLLGFSAAYLGLHYPGDFYLVAPEFSLAPSLYRLDWIPGLWVEEQLQLYHRHLDAVIYLRLPSLLLLSGLLGALTVWQRRRKDRVS